MKKLGIVMLILLSTQIVFTQDIESEVGYLYTKAKYLLDTNRDAEAVDVFSKVIKQDAHYKDAMALRAQGKLKIGKTSKARKDIMRFVEQNGITPEVVKILALINYDEKDYDSANNSLYTASLLFPKDVEILEKRAEVLQIKGNKSEACVNWYKAARLGSDIATKEISKYCGSQPDKTTTVETDEENGDENEGDNTDDELEDEENLPPNKSTTKDTTTSDTDTTNTTGTKSTDTKDNDKASDIEEVEEKEVYDLNDIDLKEGKDKWLKLDEELSVNILGGGLGDRKITNMPNILLLTDNTGKIAFNVCVGKDGKVLEAQYNTNTSTIKHKNNIKYLLRKTNDLSFKENGVIKCGMIVYNINL